MPARMPIQMPPQNHSRKGSRNRLRDRSRFPLHKHWPWLVGIAVGLVILIALGMPRLLDRAKEQVVTTRLAEHETRIADAAREAGLDPELVRAVVLAESSGDASAVSHKDAVGLMQITPITLRDVRERFDVPEGDLHDPDYNLRVGTRYLAYLMERFDGDLYAALAAYHMGPTRVRKLMDERHEDGEVFVASDATNPTTRAYVHRVIDTYRGE